jgi:FG-GAP repeat
LPPQRARAADFNGDGKPDIVLGYLFYVEAAGIIRRHFNSRPF